jgi:DNA polymerase I-like protein with 3'-5' exonuclease and polymerase domains
MIALDCETTGVDLHHGAKPFFVSTCNEEGEQQYWHWEVDPRTREPRIPGEDLHEIQEILRRARSWNKHSQEAAPRYALILQNPKFDARALATIGVTSWPWEATFDTLLAGHLLASNRLHDLTSMALQYLGVDLLPAEEALKEAVQAARRLARSKFPQWKIAGSDLPSMPSARETTWRHDYWLPRALACELGYPSDHPWHEVLQIYANQDSSATLALWQVQREEIERRGLWEIYEERRKLLPIAYQMEERGITLSGERLQKQVREYQEESDRASRFCTNLAKRRGIELSLPKSGNNKRLLEFAFEVLKLPVLKRSPETGNPSLDKTVLEAYEHTLPARSQQLAFIRALRGKRKRDTALQYMKGYRRFWKPVLTGNGEGWFVLHPSLNPTGTATLRWSSQSPNEQNIAKQEGFNLRYAFGPAPGREWWSLDAKNIELRLPAYLSGEKELIDLFERSEAPPYYGSTHLLNFHTVYPDIWEEALREVGEEKVGPYCKKKYASTWYQWCKNGDFAVQYGAIDRPEGKGTADRAFHRAGSHARLKQRFVKLEKLNQNCIRFAEKHGYVETIPDRSVNPNRGYPLLCTRTEYGRILPTVPLNYKIQGSAMWWTARAMVAVQARLAAWRSEEGFDGHITLQVHDELVLDFPKSLCPPRESQKLSNLWRIREIQDLMARIGEDFVPRVPTPVGVEYHSDNWSEGDSY